MSDDVKEELKQRLTRAMVVMQKMQARIDTLERARTEPIAIIGMGCRFPGGADTPEAFWELLASGRDAVRREPPSRRIGADSGAPRWAGYLEDVSGFDADFFGISPREAASLDPRQRLLLEVAWEALEHAGQDPERMVNTPTGVFVGLTGDDYARLLPSDPERIDAYYGTGNGHCFPPGRVSYTLGLQGPSLAVDTACSSSLVAVHLACQSLRNGECNVALAGGANLVLDPSVTETLVRMQALSPNGRCSAFDARANGFVRGEGCGLVVLKRLSDARAQGDTILAVIRGSAVNQDGRSQGLTAPNMLAQQALLRQALASAKVEPSALGYVEAHGTGTPLGDPIEAEALVEVMGRPRPDGSRCALGSVKTNLGHLEAAAGIAGLMKAVLALHHEAIPKHLNFSRLNPRIRLEGTPFFIPTELIPWRRSALSRLAGVSAFGMSGTNAHIILEEAPLPAPYPRVAATLPTHLLTLSARSEEALVAMARRHAEHLSAHPELDVADVCFTTNTTRTRMPHRLAVVGNSTAALAEGLSAVTSGTKAGNTPPKVAFLFTGQGSQFVGMGRRLYETSEVFREAIHRCASLLKPRMDLLAVLYPKDGVPSPIDQTAYSQPALFALEYALAEVWRAWGVVPDAVMGHSVGEFAAACVAGILSLEDALELIAERGRLMQALPPGGVMATVFATEAQVAPLLAPYRDRVSIAAFNAPDQLTISGAAEAVERITSALEAQGLAARKLNVSHAFHSPLLEPMLGALEAKAAGMRRSPGRVPLISNVTGRPVGPDELGAPDYWRRHAREAVRFQEGMASLRGLGIDTFVEVGPHTTLLGLGKACLGEGPEWLSSLRKGKDDFEQMLSTLGRLFVRGFELDWRKVDPEPTRRKVVLPRYPWQRQRYWAIENKAPVSEPARNAKGASYALEWRLAVREATGSAPAQGSWLLLCDRGGVGERLASRIESQGGTCVKVFPGESVTLEPGTPLAGVVYLWGLDVKGVEGIREACAGVSSVLRALEAVPGGKVWLVTRNAQAVGSERVAPGQAPLWGLGRVVALEHPERWGGLIDLGPEDGAEALWDEVRAAGGEDQIALRGGQRYVARLVERGLPEAQPVSVEAEATYLITGGQGSLGLEVARWLVRKGARHLVLTARGAFPERSAWDALESRGGALAERISAVRELECSGVHVLLARADVSRREEMAALLERVRSSMPPLRGVVHAAVATSQARVRDLDAETLDQMLAPKVDGAWNLHELTRGDSLDFFVLFSSIAAVWGSVRVGHYAAANAFLDALAAYRSAQGLVASSIDWGPWEGRGAASAEEQRWLESMGVDGLDRREALDWLERILAARVPQAVVASVRWERFRPIFESRGPRPLLAQLHAEPSPVWTPTQTAWHSEATPSARRESLRKLVEEAVARTLGLQSGQRLEAERGFAELGLDSIMAVELKSRLQEALGLTLPATLAFNFPNVRTLTEHLASRLKAETPRAPASRTDTRPEPDEPIAIVGMACRLPGGADTPEAFWELLREGRDGITEIPADRWDVNAWYDPDPEAPGKMYVRAGGFLRNVDQFDPRFFGISPREAESMDPQQRLVLEVAWEALERSGHEASKLRDTRTGVFVGVTTSDYARVILQGRPEDVDAWFASGTSLNVVAGRLSYTLGLRGPSMAVDTACSSSLVALHLACQSLRSGESTMALAAGVNLILSPEPMMAVCKARMLAPDGRCKTFDASANGFARAEGCGVLVLKRLSEAQAHGDNILAVIRGTAVNQDGPSSGLTVPNGLAQQEVIGQALRRAGVSPSEVSYLEAHGTGTSLGDPIEAEAMWSVLKDGRKGGESLWMGSVKTNLGHLESAAGVAGVMKVVLAMRHKQLPAHLHLKEPNPHIDWKGMGVKVPVELTSWEPTQGRRIAGVSSFGFSGTNAHVVLEEAPPMPERVPAESRAAPVFQRQRYWWKSMPRVMPRAPRNEPGFKPHLGRRLRSPALDALVYEAVYGRSKPAHLDHHRLFGTLVAAGSSHVAMVLSAIEDAYGSPACTLENLAFPRALVLGDDEERMLQVILAPQGNSFEVKSLGDEDGAESWVLHASGAVRVGQGEAPKSLPSKNELQARCRERRSGEGLYRAMDACGYTLKPGYQWIASIASDGDEILGEMRLPPLPDSLEDYPLYPGLVDSCFQVLASRVLDGGALRGDTLLIPFSVSRFTVYRRPRGTVWCHGRIEGDGGDLRVFDDEGLVVEILGFRGRLASREAVRLATHARREEARYEITWRPESSPWPGAAPKVDGRPWVLFADAQGAGERLASLLREHGAPVVLVPAGASHDMGFTGCAGVVYLRGLDAEVPENASAESVQRAALEASGGALHLVKALTREGTPAPLWLVTRGAQAVKDTRVSVAQATLWGLGKVVDLEHPELRCTRVDLDPDDMEGSLQLLFTELGRDGGTPEREVAFRGGARQYPSLQRDASGRGNPFQLRADATYLLTGGLGGLGLEVAKWMVAQGARHLVLVGRRAPPDSAAETVRALERSGAQVIVASVDVSREAEVARLLLRLDTEAPPLRGIIHAAGVLDDGALAQQTLERFERVMTPKVAGAWNLHRLTVDRPLDFFVLFSSASATLGSPGQGNYAAANAFLDALASERRARGQVAQSLGWGPWAETGMASAADSPVARALAHRGIRPLRTQQALALFGEALASGRPRVALMSIQWPVYLEGLGALGRSSFYAALAPAHPTEPRPAATPESPRYPLAERLQAALPRERPALLARSLQEEITRILRLDASTPVDWRQGFAELGMDSLMAIELRNVLQKGLGRSVPATVALDHPTIDFLAKHLLTEVLKLDDQEAPPAASDDLDALSDAELARLVAEDLAKDS